MKQILIGCNKPVTRDMLCALFCPDEIVLFAGSPDAFTRALVEPIDHVFLIYWSWKLGADVIAKCKPIGFHMSALPYGRGGTPLQNLVEAGITHTELCMLELTDELDAGPILDKQPLCIEGPADEVYARAGLLVCQRIRAYLDSDCNWIAQPQERAPVEFHRRVPAQSELPTDGDLTGLLRHIRMLDAEGYPHAFVDHGAFRLNLRRATLRGERILTDCEISVIE